MTIYVRWEHDGQIHIECLFFIAHVFVLVPSRLCRRGRSSGPILQRLMRTKLLRTTNTSMVELCPRYLHRRRKMEKYTHTHWPLPLATICFDKFGLETKNLAAAWRNKAWEWQRCKGLYRGNASRLNQSRKISPISQVPAFESTLVIRFIEFI